MNVTACPCCGGAVKPTAIMVDLNGNRLSVGWLNTVVRLSPREAEIAHVLVKANNRYVKAEFIRQTVWEDAEDGSDRTNVRVHIGRLRKKIDRLGLAIINGGTSGTGYKIERVPGGAVVS